MGHYQVRRHGLVLGSLSTAMTDWGEFVKQGHEHERRFDNPHRLLKPAEADPSSSDPWNEVVAAHGFSWARLRAEEERNED